MREARDLAERVSRARSAFLANMSHEIRTPMNAVLGFIELVLDTELSTEQRRALELVRASSETLLAILNDILDYSKIEAEHLDLETIPFDLAKVVHATASLLAVRAREKHLELLAEIAPDVPRAVRGDPTRLRQVLTNLIGNAIKFTDAGEVVVTVTRVGTEPEDGRARLRFSVRDTGIGIAPDHVKSIFEEFIQADVSMTRRYGGTGLGLAISQRLVKLMGGALEVASDVGRGSDFHFTVAFPIETTPGGLPTGRATLAGHRMLVVDDNQTNRRILRDLLAAEGTVLDEASSGSAGLETLRRAATQGTPYDLAILDVQMPDRDGFDVASEVRADRGLAATRLLMLTSAGQRGDGKRCRTLGIEGYLTKPISRADLLEALAVVLAAPATPVAAQAPATPAGPARPAGGRVPELVTRHSIVESRPTLRILLAEDNPVNQQVASALLLKRGHQVDVVSDGRQAVAAVEREIYDVVLMDIQMPEMDGFAATAAIRALPGREALPIIALTAHALSGERERCLAHGMTGYLAKPFKSHELFALIETREGPPPRTHMPVDVAGFRETMREAGAGEAVDGILDSFVAQLPERLAALETAMTNGHPDATARAAHALKGSAATIGAQELARLLERIETTARAGVTAAPGLESDAVAGVGPGDLGDARELLEQVQGEARAVLEFLREQRAP
jgi:two-component system sensor histidine kinase/response regulator